MRGVAVDDLRELTEAPFGQQAVHAAEVGAGGGAGKVQVQAVPL
jgi:hypothetical protein